MGGTCTASFLVYHVAIQTATDGASSNFVNTALNLGASARVSSVVTNINVDLGMWFRGHIAVANAGTLTIQVGNGAPTVNVLAGGLFTLEQIA